MTMTLCWVGPAWIPRCFGLFSNSTILLSRNFKDSGFVMGHVLADHRPEIRQALTPPIITVIKLWKTKPQEAGGFEQTEVAAIPLPFSIARPRRIACFFSSIWICPLAILIPENWSTLKLNLLWDRGLRALDQYSKLLFA